MLEDVPIKAALCEVFGSLGPEVVLDVGAADGKTALEYARMFPSAKIHAFEPVPRNARAARDACGADVTVHEVALSDYNGEAVFWFSSGAPPDGTASRWDWSGSLRAPKRVRACYPWCNFTEGRVQVRRLDAIEGVRRADYIHLDVQGAELDVLCGAGDLLATTRAVFLEVCYSELYAGQPSVEDIMQFLHAAGFTFVGGVLLDPISTDQLWIRKLSVPRPVLTFQNENYRQHNAARQAHVASLRLLKPGMCVLETGAGIGDHTVFLRRLGCDVVATEARAENLAVLRSLLPDVDARFLDLDAPDPTFPADFDAVYCYGTLYHLSTPEVALAFMATRAPLLLLETCVSYDDALAINPCEEDAGNPSQSFRGGGCKPTRRWIWEELHKHFAHVYAPRTQPQHPEFPLDWTKQTNFYLNRAVFVASRTPLDSPLLLDYLPDAQESM